MPSTDLNDPDSERTFAFALFADYYQLYLEDCRLASELDQREGEDPDVHGARIDAYVATVLSPEAHARQLGVAHGTLCFLTAHTVTVPLTIHLRADAPANDFTGNLPRMPRGVTPSGGRGSRPQTAIHPLILMDNSAQ